MKDLVYAVKHSRLFAYADDTQIFFADSTPEKVEEVINADLANVDQWYEQNGIKENTSKYQGIVTERHRPCRNSIAKTRLFLLLKIPKCLELQ